MGTRRKGGFRLERIIGTTTSRVSRTCVGLRQGSSGQGRCQAQQGAARALKLKDQKRFAPPAAEPVPATRRSAEAAEYARAHQTVWSTGQGRGLSVLSISS